MQFRGTHTVRAEDIARAMRLTTRPTDVLISGFVVVVLIAILSQVIYAFFIYLKAAAGSPGKLLDLLLVHDGATNAVFGWLSILVTLCLPVFLFYSMRALAEALSPVWRARRLAKTSDLTGPVTYTVDDLGVRSQRVGGVDTFMPWANFDGIRHDAEIVALTRGRQLQFFVPLAAFGPQQDEVLTHIKAAVLRDTGDMNRRQNWRKVLGTEVQRWSALPCDRLLSELSDVKVYEVQHESKTYQVEVEILENTTTYVHVMVAVDDGSLPASISPETDSFICRKHQ
jgi:hypothetical protein